MLRSSKVGAEPARQAVLNQPLHPSHKKFSGNSMVRLPLLHHQPKAGALAAPPRSLHTRHRAGRLVPLRRLPNAARVHGHTPDPSQRHNPVWDHGQAHHTSAARGAQKTARYAFLTIRFIFGIPIPYHDFIPKFMAVYVVTKLR